MKTPLFLFLFLPLYAMSQVWDDFSDGDFTNNPVWMGTDTCFLINSSGQLQSTATIAGEAYLATGITSLRSGSFQVTRNETTWRPADDDWEWRFWIRENFSPSGNNYAEVWLTADTPDPRQASRGYFLRFGASGSQDAIELYRKDAAAETLICKGNDAAIASSFKMAVKVHRDRDGRWTIWMDAENIGYYILETEGFDDTFSPEGYFGFYIKYTVSNAKKFYFDDIYVGPKIIDQEPPELLQLTVVDGHHLLLTFSESLSETALEPQHYMVGNDIPDTVSFYQTVSKVLLCFNNPLPGNTNLQLKITGITDISGNVISDTLWNFNWYQASENDVVINEIMADPTPVVGLPEWEYVELFNTTDLVVDLKDWTLQIGTTSKTFPAIQLSPAAYLILCKDDAEGAFSVYGPTCPFSSFTIANAGATLRLLSPEETLVSEVSFNDTWYHDADKKNGGWSLEQIDPFNPCAGTVNWSASEDVSGGTPGRENSINAPNATLPQVDHVSVLGENLVLVWFDQQMDAQSLADPYHYYVEETGTYPAEVTVNPVNSNAVELFFPDGFLEGVIYTLLVNEVENCSGHPILADTRVLFGIPNTIEAGDILINEILFDPINPGVDYVELYNVSDKAFDLNELKLGVVKESFPNPADTVLKLISEASRLLMPHSFLLLSTDAFTVGQQYGCEISDYVDMTSFPSFANSGGTAMLMSREGVVVDEMVFSEAMHDPFLKETKGVSLERVSWEVPSMQADNWHSAAAAVHYGTPGYGNSMAADPSHQTDEGHVHIQPQTFSPDGDGRDDHCRIMYDLEKVGGTANVYVFSSDGQLVRHLIKGEVISGQGSFLWNGLDQKGQHVPLGLYVVVTEVYDSKGTVEKYKNVVAVSSR